MEMHIQKVTIIGLLYSPKCLLCILYMLRAPKCQTAIRMPFLKNTHWYLVKWPVSLKLTFFIFYLVLARNIWTRYTWLGYNFQFNMLYLTKVLLYKTRELKKQKPYYGCLALVIIVSETDVQDSVGIYRQLNNSLYIFTIQPVIIIS